MGHLTLKELTEKLERKLRKELKTSESPKLKVDFELDALWISNGEAKARGKDDITEYYKFWEASEFKEFRDAEEVLNDEDQMRKVGKVEVIYAGGKKEFRSWKDFLKWLGE
ncbi:MAG: hypothetical protein QXO32_06775 [Candidatus Bathyarchaeia archaeon]